MLWTSFFFYFIRRWMLKNKLVVSGDWLFFSFQKMLFSSEKYFSASNLFDFQFGSFIIFLSSQVSQQHASLVCWWLMWYATRSTRKSTTVSECKWTREMRCTIIRLLSRPIPFMNEILLTALTTGKIVSWRGVANTMTVQFFTFFFFWHWKPLEFRFLRPFFIEPQLTHTHTYAHNQNVLFNVWFFFAGQHVLIKQIPFLF